MIRIFLAVVSFVSVLFAPLWVSVILGLVLAFFWEAWEVVLLGLLIDFLYLPPGGLWHIPMPATLIAIAFVWVMIPIRKRIFLK